MGLPGRHPKNNAFDHDGHGILRYIYINDTHHFWTKRKS
jgi:hypothetical protein